MHLNNIINKNYLIVSIFLGLILHLISAYCSIGFYSDDEHFQILEIASYLLGINEIAIEDTTGHYWEWRNHIRMRPWFQPYIFYQFINFLQLIGINDSFSWALYLRLTSSLIGFGSIVILYFTFRDYFFQRYLKLNTFVFFSFWFYPFLHSRTSSENLGISLFIISFCLLFNLLIKEKLKFNYLLLIFSSFTMGLSLVIKFTLVFSAVPFFLWLIIFKFRVSIIAIFCLCSLLALSLGLYIDYLNWGSFTNTYYQFYYWNLNDEWGRLNEFGINPWYFYLTQSVKQLAPLLSLFFILGLFLYWIKNPKKIITWITLISAIIFSIIGHKEIRYIFLIYTFAPFFLAYLINHIKFKNIRNIVISLVLVSNIIFLFITLFIPSNSKVGVYDFIYKNYQQNISIYYIGENPLQINNMVPYFYTKFLPDINEFNNENLNNNNSWIVTNDYDEFKKNIKSECEIIYTTYPKKIINLNPNWKRLKINWYIFNC
jgi:GPI mannosyltransferase 3